MQLQGRDMQVYRQFAGIGNDILAKAFYKGKHIVPLSPVNFCDVKSGAKIYAPETYEEAVKLTLSAQAGRSGIEQVNGTKVAATNLNITHTKRGWGAILSVSISSLVNGRKPFEVSIVDGSTVLNTFIIDPPKNGDFGEISVAMLVGNDTGHALPAASDSLKVRIADGVIIDGQIAGSYLLTADHIYKPASRRRT